MAPHHQRFADPLLVKLGEPLKVLQAEQNILQHGKQPKVMRCTSVNYSEEEESMESEPFNGNEGKTMAPHQWFADPLLVKLGEPLKVSQAEQNILQHGKQLKVMRCTSVNYSEEEESKNICCDESDYLRSTTCRNKPWWFLPSVWPGIIPSLDPIDQGQKKRKNEEEKIVLETEDRKKAVENDDQTESFESTTLASPPKDEKPWTPDLPSKDFSCGKAELGCPGNLLLIPYPIQESIDDTQAENVTAGTENPPRKILNICEVEEWAGKDESDLQEDVAHVQLYEDVKILTAPRKRHAVRKVKRNCWEVTEPDLPCKKKRTCRGVQTRKAKKTKTVAHNKAPVSVEDIDEIIAQFTETDKLLRETLSLDTTFKQQNVPVNTAPKDSDSGVHSQSNNNGSSAAQGNSGGSGGSSTEEEGSGKHSGGNSGDDGDDGRDKKEKAPWWCFPGGENTNAKVKKKKKEKERKKTEESCEERMDLDAPDMSRFQFLPSEIDQTEQCHHGAKDVLMGADVVTDTGMPDFSPQDLQHSCYCSRNVCDVNIKCKAVKEELKHMGAHKKWSTCLRCKNTRKIVNQHATFCKRNGCRVPDCNQLRNGLNGLAVKHGPPFQVQIPVLNPFSPHWPRSPPIFTKPRIPAIDGTVIFRNSTIFPERHFSEHIDYHVQRQKKVGEGSNGDIYGIFVQAHRNLDWVVKETRYEMPLEEIEVYKAVGFHKHIVKIFGATFRGSGGKVNLFMEKCDQSLYEYINAKGSRLPIDEAMFYWLQVLDAVLYLHSLPVPVIHKDIKAKNVVLTSEYSRAKLCDLDSAIRLPDELTEAGLRPLGTRGFAAPEVRERKRHGRPADIYSLACLLIEETVGVPSTDTLEDKINQLRQLDPDLAELVKECTKTRPEDRPTAGQLVQCPALQKFREWQRS